MEKTLSRSEGRTYGLSPMTLLREFTNEMDRAFRGMAPWSEPLTTHSAGEMAAWAPALDIQNCEGELVVTAELPGLKKDEVKVELTDNALVIKGERKREHREDHAGYHRYERSYGQFYRSVSLPEGTKTDQVKAEMKDGVLKISVPVPKVENKSRAIPIEAVK